MWVYTREEKVYTQGQLKMTHINFVMLDSYVKVIYSRFVKNTYFQGVKNIKLGNSCIGFFQAIKLTIYKTLLPAEKFGNINLHQQTVILKIIYDFRIEISFMENQEFLISKKFQSDMYFQLQ